MRVPESIMIDGDRKDLSWIKERTRVANKRVELLIEGLCTRALNERYRKFPEDVARIAKVVSMGLPPFLERYGEDLYLSPNEPVPEVLFIKQQPFRSYTGANDNRTLRDVEHILFSACELLLKDVVKDVGHLWVLDACGRISHLLDQVFMENAGELFNKNVRAISTPYINVPKSIAISGRVINIEWLSRAYLKEPDMLRERFIFCVVQEILRTVSFRQACEYRGIVTDTISRGLYPFLKKYAHLIFNHDTAYPYRTLVDLPDRVEIGGQIWWIGCFKRPDVSSKSAISGLISRVAEVCLKRNPSIHLDFAEIKCLADSFASKFCQFLELNAEDLFGNVSEDTPCVVDPVKKSIADAQSELQVIIEDFTELRKDIGDVMQEVRLLKTTESKVLADENAVLKQKVEFLSDENRRLKECVAALILKETLQLYLDQD